MTTVQQVLLVLALVCFGAAAANVVTGANLIALGLALGIGAQLVRG